MQASLEISISLLTHQLDANYIGSSSSRRWTAGRTLTSTVIPDYSDGKFPEIFTGGNFPYDVRASVFTC
jgi:hypothetical protein